MSFLFFVSNNKEFIQQPLIQSLYNTNLKKKIIKRRKDFSFLGANELLS